MKLKVKQFDGVSSDIKIITGTVRSHWMLITKLKEQRKIKVNLIIKKKYAYGQGRKKFKKSQVTVDCLVPFWSVKFENKK